MAALTFQSTPPVWGATYCDVTYAWYRSHFNPRPPCGGRLVGFKAHSLTCRNFNPRPPCGGRLFIYCRASLIVLFQSTPPVWGATAKTHKNAFLFLHISCKRLLGKTNRTYITFPLATPSKFFYQFFSCEPSTDTCSLLYRTHQKNNDFLSKKV